MRTRLIALFLIFDVSVVAWFFATQPRADRLWIEEQSKTATWNEESQTLHNVRDWTYDAAGPVTTEWLDVTLENPRVTQVWFLIEPFADWDAIAHTFLSFEFEDGTSLSFSIEARREVGEEYSAFLGLFRKYELSYQWGTERDFIARRLVYLNHPVQMYPLNLTDEQAQKVFEAFLAETNELAENPRSYNTLTANCTNMLAVIINTHFPDTLPYDLSWQFTGYTTTYLEKEGLIPGAPVAPSPLGADLTQHKDVVAAHASDSPEAFSVSIRSLLP